MNSAIITDIFRTWRQCAPKRVERCSVGLANQVYIVECEGEKYVLRCNPEGPYSGTIHWLTELSSLDIPVPRVLHSGKAGDLHYLILNYMEGEDLGLVYPSLLGAEKKRIAKAVTEIQKTVSHLPLENVDPLWSWHDYLDAMLARAETRIEVNGYFASGRVHQLKVTKVRLDAYFSTIRPTAYLDDISTKNLLIHNGQLSGIIDIDWMGVGDSLTFIALTYVALRNMGYDTDYAEYLLEERSCNPIEQKAFLFYCLMYCVDFMGERGMRFGDKTVAVNEEIVDRLNWIYDDLWKKWCQ